MRATLIGFLFLAACGGGEGGSGVPGGTPIADLTPAELSSVCARFVDLLGPERTVTCEDGSTTTVGASAEDQAECEDDLGSVMDACSITVGEYESCIEAIGSASDDEICNDEFPAECAVLQDPNC